MKRFGERNKTYCFFFQADEYHEKVFKLIDMVDFPDYINNTFLNTLGQVVFVLYNYSNAFKFSDSGRSNIGLCQ